MIAHSVFLLYVFVIFSQPPYGYRSLTDITLDHVTYIGMYAFYKRNSPRSLTLQEYTAAIGDYAFAYCTGLTRSIYVTVQSQPVRITIVVQLSS
ncbi:MAG: leucine-rich repeat protein [Blautia sp.]